MPLTRPRWSRASLRAIDEHLEKLGLSDCPVCRAGDAMRVKDAPALIQIGDRGDEETRDMYYAVFCRICAYSLLFDSGKRYDAEDPKLTLATDEEQLS